MQLTVTWNDSPVPDGEIVVIGPDENEFKTTTNQNGIVIIQDALPGRYEIRAKRTQSTPGEHNGQAYTEVRHYCTLTFELATRTGMATFVQEGSWVNDLRGEGEAG